MLKFVLTSLFTLFLGATILILPSPILAQQTQPIEGHPNDPGGERAYVVDGVVTIQALEAIVANFLAIAVSGIGFVGFIMMIIGAFKYLLSGGNTQQTEGGKNTMTFAVIGLILALTAYMILNFIAEFTGVRTILNFTLWFNG